MLLTIFRKKIKKIIVFREKYIVGAKVLGNIGGGANIWNILLCTYKYVSSYLLNWILFSIIFILFYGASGDLKFA